MVYDVNCSLVLYYMLWKWNLNFFFLKILLSKDCKGMRLLFEEFMWKFVFCYYNLNFVLDENVYFFGFNLWDGCVIDCVSYIIRFISG